MKTVQSCVLTHFIISQLLFYIFSKNNICLVVHMHGKVSKERDTLQCHVDLCKARQKVSHKITPNFLNTGLNTNQISLTLKKGEILVSVLWKKNLHGNFHKRLHNVLRVHSCMSCLKLWDTELGKKNSFIAHRLWISAVPLWSRTNPSLGALYEEENMRQSIPTRTHLKLRWLLNCWIHSAWSTGFFICKQWTLKFWLFCSLETRTNCGDGVTNGTQTLTNSSTNDSSITLPLADRWKKRTAYVNKWMTPCN